MAINHVNFDRFYFSKYKNKINIKLNSQNLIGRFFNDAKFKPITIQEIIYFGFFTIFPFRKINR